MIMNQKKPKQQYVHYLEWEDFHAGMWRRVDNEDEWLKRAIEFTGDHVLYGHWMRIVIEQWPRTMLHNLTNPSMNKRALLGHCAVCLAIGCPEYITRMAWKQLTDQQRRDADAVAQETINDWYEKQNRAVHQDMGAAVLS